MTSIWVFKNENDACPICKAPIFEKLDLSQTQEIENNLTLIDEIAYQGSMYKLIKEGTVYDSTGLKNLAFKRDLRQSYCLPGTLKKQHSQPADLHRVDAYRSILTNFDQICNQKARIERTLKLLKEENPGDLT